MGEEASTVDSHWYVNK